MVRIIFLFSGVRNLLNCHKGFKQPTCQGLQKEVGEAQICTAAPSSSDIQQEPLLLTCFIQMLMAEAQRCPAVCALGFNAQNSGVHYIHSIQNPCEFLVVNTTPNLPMTGAYKAALQKREGCSLSLGTQPSSPALAENLSVLLDSVQDHSQMSSFDISRYPHPHVVNNQSVWY